VNVAPHPPRPLPRSLLLRPPSPSAAPSPSQLSSNPALRPLCLGALSPVRSESSVNSAVSQSSPRPSPSETNNLQLRTINTHESPATSHKSRRFMHLPALKLSCLSFSCPRPLFSIVCGLFCENTGGGIPLPHLHGSHLTSHTPRPSCAKAQKTPPVSPLPATLTHSLSRKSLPCHSYANTRDVGARRLLATSLSPLESALTKSAPVSPLECALTKTPRGWHPPRSIRLCVLCAGACPDRVGVANPLVYLPLESTLV